MRLHTAKRVCVCVSGPSLESHAPNLGQLPDVRTSLSMDLAQLQLSLSMDLRRVQL